MFTTKSQISQAIETKTKEATEFMNRQTPTDFQEVQGDFPGMIGPNNMVPCVFIQQVSARKYQVGWRFTKVGTSVGEMQQDPHMAYNRDQEIAWVYGIN